MMTMLPAPESLLPLKPVELMILVILERGDCHGYGIRQAMVEESGGRIAIEAGNLYRHVRALEDAGTISECASPPEETDARRIYYRLAPLGRRVLAAELRRLQSLVQEAETRGIIARGRA